jgi:hypothetical protein
MVMTDWRTIISGKKTNSSERHPQNPQNSIINNNIADFADVNPENEIKKYGSFTIEQLKKFLGEDWSIYQHNPQALQLWAEILADKEKMIKAGVYTKQQYENLFNNER